MKLSNRTKIFLTSFVILITTTLFFFGIYLIDMGHNGIIVKEDYVLVSLISIKDPNAMYHLGFVFCTVSFLLAVSSLILYSSFVGVENDDTEKTDKNPVNKR